jgi:hypothetical protein
MLKKRQIRVIVNLLFGFAIFLASIFFSSKVIFAVNDETLDHILINEVCSKSSCEGGEWVELFNPTEETIDLSVYTLEDNLHQPHKLSGTIKNGGYAVIDFSGLNDSGDCMILKNNEQVEPIDMIFYGNYVDEEIKNDILKNAEAPKLGESITRKPNTLITGNSNVDFIIAVPTPGIGYQEVVTEVENDILNIDEARNLENGESVMINGLVTTLPGVLSLSYFYIQDETGGIQVYCNDKNFPKLALGDTISVFGRMSETNKERRIKIDGSENIIILNHTDPVEPEEIAISDIGEKEEGTYVKTAGIVTQTSGDQFYVSDGQSEIKVVINKSTKIDKPKMKKGDQVEVSGIVSQYKDEYRILPIDQDDVKIVASKEQLPRAGNGEYIYFMISLSLFALWNLFLKVKKKLIKLLLVY